MTTFKTACFLTHFLTRKFDNHGSYRAKKCRVSYQIKTVGLPHVLWAERNAHAVSFSVLVFVTCFFYFVMLVQNHPLVMKMILPY